MHKSFHFENQGMSGIKVGDGAVGDVGAGAIWIIFCYLNEKFPSYEHLWLDTALLG
jgi:hypothetical protein